MTILVTGFPGTTATQVVLLLREAGIRPRVGARAPGRIEDTAGMDVVRFDFTDPSTWDAAFAGVETMFLVRPPQLSDVARDIVPALEQAQRAGVRHVVFLSIQGAARNRVVPHHRIERWLAASSVDWTFIRAAYFMQNLLTTHADDLAAGRIAVPAGGGRTALVDVRDVAAVASAALLHPDSHRNAAHTVTGPAALTYYECAEILTTQWGEEITYTAPGVRAYWHAMRRGGMPAPMVAVTVGIYTAARLGLASGTTDTVQHVTGSPARSFEEFAADYAPDRS